MNNPFVRKSCLHLSVLLLGGRYIKMEELWGLRSNAITISQMTMRNIKQNLFWAFAYIALLIPVAAGVFYPMFGVLLSPALAAGAMALSSVFLLVAVG
jgi:cation transport ATPase